jgi:hypothetical protein
VAPRSGRTKTPTAVAAGRAVAEAEPGPSRGGRWPRGRADRNRDGRRGAAGGHRTLPGPSRGGRSPRGGPPKRTGAFAARRAVAEAEPGPSRGGRWPRGRADRAGPHGRRGAAGGRRKLPGPSRRGGRSPRKRATEATAVIAARRAVAEAATFTGPSRRSPRGGPPYDRHGPSRRGGRSPYEPDPSRRGSRWARASRCSRSAWAWANVGRGLFFRALMPRTGARSLRAACPSGLGLRPILGFFGASLMGSLSFFFKGRFSALGGDGFSGRAGTKRPDPSSSAGARWAGRGCIGRRARWLPCRAAARSSRPA